MKIKTTLVIALVGVRCRSFWRRRLVQAQSEQGNAKTRQFPPGTRARLASGYKFIKQKSGATVVSKDNKPTGITIACQCSQEDVRSNKHECNYEFNADTVHCVPGTGCASCDMHIKLLPRWSSVIHFETQNGTPVRSQ